MYVIRERSGKYLKSTANKITLTTNETLANNFSTFQDAFDFINNRIAKRRRNLFTPVEIRVDSKKVSKLIPEYPLGDSNIYNKIDESVKILIKEEIERLEKKVDYYDDVILDIRHYIRNDNTKVNACYGYKIFQLLQLVERKRISCKEEIIKLNKFQHKFDNLLGSVSTFSLEPYKPRVLNDIENYISGTKQID